MPDLLTLLDSTRPISDAERSGLLAMLRTHPRLEDEFARLEALAGEIGAETLQEAAELHQMFDNLCRSEWHRPAEILGSRVPYAQLLAIAEAQLAEASPDNGSKPREVLSASRISKVIELLAQAEQEAAARPVTECFAALKQLRISKAGIRRAITAGRCRYLESEPSPPKRPSLPSAKLNPEVGSSLVEAIRSSRVRGAAGTPSPVDALRQNSYPFDGFKASILSLGFSMGPGNIIVRP